MLDHTCPFILPAPAHGPRSARSPRAGCAPPRCRAGWRGRWASRQDRTNVPKRGGAMRCGGIDATSASISVQFISAAIRGSSANATQPTTTATLPCTHRVVAARRRRPMAADGVTACAPFPRSNRSDRAGFRPGDAIAR